MRKFAVTFALLSLPILCFGRLMKGWPETSGRFILFLKLESDGRYAPVSGQTDPALFDVVKLNGMAR